MTDVKAASSAKKLNEAIDQGGRVIVLYHAPSWCVPCRRFHPHWLTAAKAIDTARFVEYDIDQDLQVSTQRNVLSVPTVVVYQDGQEIARLHERTAVSLVREIQALGV